MNTYIFKATADNSAEMKKTISRLKADNITKLVLAEDEYHFNYETAAEEVCCIANHGCNGFKKSAFLLRNIENLEIDCSGSAINLHGVMNAFIIKNCKGITLKNCIIKNVATQHTQFEVINVCDEYVDMKLCAQQDYCYRWGSLYLCDGNGNYDIVFDSLEVDKNTFEFVSADQNFGCNFMELKTSELENGVIRVYNPPQKPKIGNYIILMAAQRYSNAVFVTDSEDICLENVTVQSTYGMGFLAQSCKNIILDGFNVTRADGMCFTANADATHFVGCTGDVKIKNCTMENQLDDCVNIHGVYTKIISKDEEYITVKFMHSACKGINIYNKGDKIEVLNPLTLIPYHEFTVEAVEVINTECVRIKVSGGTENINVNDVTDNISLYPAVLIENCRFLNNRARGMLIGSREKVIIRNNYFHSSGTAIKLESDGRYWFESGGVKDILIENNIFDNCKYVIRHGWGEYVIDVESRPVTESERFFHGKMIVRNNDFSTCRGKLVHADNMECFIFENNKTSKFSDKKVVVKHCKTVFSEN